MRSLSGLGVALSLLFGFLFLALVAEVYYLLWWKKRVAAVARARAGADADDASSASAREFLDLFCWKKPSSLAAAREICTSVRVVDGSEGGQLHLGSHPGKEPILKPLGVEEGLDAELMRLHCLQGPPRILFTIREETGEELESEEGRSRRRRTLSDLLLVADSGSPAAPLCFNPLFESRAEDERRWVWPSPPPKFQFLRDAEEKLYRKTLAEEALKVQALNGVSPISSGKDSPFLPIGSPQESTIVGCSC